MVALNLGQDEFDERGNLTLVARGHRLANGGDADGDLRVPQRIQQVSYFPIVGPIGSLAGCEKSPTGKCCMH